MPPKDQDPAENLPDTDAPAAAPAPSRDPVVQVRITKAGAGHVHTGDWDNENNRPAYYQPNEIVLLKRSIGESLEGRHFGEIQ